MTSFHGLEASTYAELWAIPFTRIQGKLDWKQMKTLQQEMEDTAMACTVSYDWADDYGLLAEIQGAVRYLQLTTQNYVQHVKPPHTHPAILPNTTAHIVRLCTAEKKITEARLGHCLRIQMGRWRQLQRHSRQAVRSFA